MPLQKMSLQFLVGAFLGLWNQTDITPYRRARAAGLTRANYRDWFP